MEEEHADSLCELTGETHAIGIISGNHNTGDGYRGTNPCCVIYFVRGELRP